MQADERSQLIRDWRKADLDPQDRAMLEFAEKLTVTPVMVGDDDVEALRKAGFDDTQVLEIVLLTAYRNFTNRFALGLGIAPDPRIEGIEQDPEIFEDFEAVGAR